MQKAFGAYGSLYRTGGDEFVALIHADEETLAGIMEKVNSIMESWKGINVKELSISVGYASHREFPDLTMEELGRTADKKMYEAKTAYYQKHDRRRRT